MLSVWAAAFPGEVAATASADVPQPDIGLAGAKCFHARPRLKLKMRGAGRSTHGDGAFSSSYRESRQVGGTLLILIGALIIVVGAFVLAAINEF